MPREILDADDRVKEVHQMKKRPPSPYRTVRVENYDNAVYGRGAVFQWDPELSAPSPDKGHIVASVVQGYRKGEANEGAWALLRSVCPLDEGFIVGHPTAGISRPFDRADYDSTEATISAASAYVDARGGGVVLVPSSVSYDPAAVSGHASTEIITPPSKRQFRISSDATSQGPGTYLIDTSTQPVTFTLAAADERGGLELTVKRVGRFDVMVETESSAAVAGDTAVSLDDRASLDFTFDSSRNDWLIL